MAASEPDASPARAHTPLSPQFILLLAVAIAATMAFVIIVVVQVTTPPPPPPDSGQPGRGGPPQLAALVIASAAVFALSWIAVMLTYARDLIMSRVNALDAAVRVLRGGLADDRRDELASLTERIVSLTSEFGDQRETDGYLNGMRQAGKRQAVPGQVPPGVPRLHQVPPAE